MEVANIATPSPPESTEPKEEPTLIICGHELKPLSDELKQRYRVGARVPRRKSMNLAEARAYEVLPIDLKIRQLIQYLLVEDLRSGSHQIQWSFTDPSDKFCWVTSIQNYEVFPYFLYKAAWDEDFEAIQWGEHSEGETILVNFELLFMFARGQGEFAPYRPTDYVDNFVAGESNRLEHNLVHIYGFNGIGCENLEEDRLLNTRSHVLDDFFNKLDGICHKYGIRSTGQWHEFHHSDFFQSDNPNIEDRHRPKRKNSKFFKICQTLKLDYRVRKHGFERNAQDGVPKPIRKR